MAGDWLCARCCVGASDAECSLCLLRGGALKATDGGQWAHLVCAVSIPEVSLADPAKREPVVTDKITRARRKLRCSLCQSVAGNTTSRGHGICVQCIQSKCCSPMHVSCALYKGLIIERRASVSGFLCSRHSVSVCMWCVCVLIPVSVWVCAYPPCLHACRDRMDLHRHCVLGRRCMCFKTRGTYHVLATLVVDLSPLWWVCTWWLTSHLCGVCV